MELEKTTKILGYKINFHEGIIRLRNTKRE